jgi:hypothetical protein
MSDSNFVVEEENPPQSPLALLSIKANAGLAQMTQEELTELVKKLRLSPPKGKTAPARVKKPPLIEFNKDGAKK